MTALGETQQLTWLVVVFEGRVVRSHAQVHRLVGPRSSEVHLSCPRVLLLQLLMLVLPLPPPRNLLLLFLLNTL